MPASAFRIQLSKTSPQLAEEIQRSVCPAENLAKAMAERVEGLLVRHFAQRDQNAQHRSGFPRSGFWAEAAKRLHVAQQGGEATITVAKPGAALHYYGGTVRSLKGKALAIPARAEAAGVNPREYDPSRSRLFLWWPKGRRAGALAKREGSGHLTILWWLVGATHHKPDPTVLPDEARVRETAEDAAWDALDAWAATHGRTA